MSNKYELPQLKIARSQRRAMVVLQQTLGTVVLALFLATPFAQLPLWMVVGFVLAMLLQMVLHTTLAISISNLAQRPLSELDELQRNWRDQAFVQSFRIVGWVVSVAWVYAALAWMLGGWLPLPEQFWLVLWAIGMMVYGLPTSIVAWRMPDLNE